MKRQWSYSSMSTYRKCPLAYWYSKMSDEPQPPSGKAAARGTRVHEQVEAYMLGNRSDLPREALSFSEEIDALVANEALPEMEIAFDEEWRTTDWDTAWTRGKLDASVPERGLVVDFKTGRYYPGHREQAELYALYSHKLGIQEDDQITVEFYYFDLNDCVTWNYPISDMEKIEAKWVKFADELDAEEEWRANPSESNCRWCNWKEQCEWAET